MSKTMKRVSALLLAILMIVTYMPMMQETAYAAKAKKPAKVKGLKATVKKGTKKIAISWKKAKNAKKYEVTIKDLSTKLTAKKTTKKKKLPVTGQWSTKYKITVKGVNGKKKGKGASKTVKIGADPKLTKSQAALKKAQSDLTKAQSEYDKLKDDKKATDDQLAQAEQNLEVASEQYAKLDAQAREQLKSATSLTLDTWNPEVKSAINAMITENSGKPNKYVVFDFDNTCSIFDVEEQLAVYQLQKMAFAFGPDEIEDVLKEGLNPEYISGPAKASGDYCANKDASYQDWIDDIKAAYTKLVDKYGQFTAAGLDEAKQKEIQEDADWKEFATKMRAMYDCVFDSESADVAYPWVLYWFTGMSHEEVYNLAKESHTKYKNVASTEETWETPGTGSKIGAVSYTWTSGTQVSQNIVELMAALDNAGIDVWVCSASATDPIRAAIDVFGLHDVVTGMLAMTNKYESEKYIHKYDYETGFACIPTSGGAEEVNWTYGDKATKAQTQGVGKSDAIQNAIAPEYGYNGPIAGFMDSTGDFNFCTEFKDLEVVCCFNRASRKTTDGGGLIAEIAVYEADDLHYDYAAARAAGDTLYVLQGRQENGFRDLLNDQSTKGRGTLTLGSSSVKVFRDKESDDDNTAVEDKYKKYDDDGNWKQGDNYKGNSKQYDYIKNNDMTVKDAINTFAYKTSFKDSGDYGYKYGFLKDFYSGYHSKTGKFAETLGKKSWNPEVKYALNDMMAAERSNGKYVVFDFDNTCSIFDVEEQLAVYQLQHMAFDETVDVAELREILKEELKASYFTEKAKASADYCGNPDATYQDWIDDIAAAYEKLLKSEFAVEKNPETGIGHFTPAGLSENDAEKIQKTDDWKEFAAKMRAMYDCVFDSESAAVAYPWVLYWFTGMSEEEVYQLAYNSHDFYSKVDTKRVTWESPYDADKSQYDDDGASISFDKENAKTKIGYVEYTWTYGTQVSDNIKELWATLDKNGIDVWVCSASATDPIRAAIDVWGGHDHIKGLMAMTNKLDENGKYLHKYDWEGGYAWKTADTTENHGWVKDTELQKTQTQGKGKVIAIQNVLYPKYNNEGPIAGFMDSTGDYNFCTEFKTLQVVCCFNRADRKPTDGGGVIAELAVYEADTLKYDYASARAAGDTLYVLQGRNEIGRRGFNPRRTTTIYKRYAKGDTNEYLFRSDYDTDAPYNAPQLQCMIDKNLSVEDVVNNFAKYHNQKGEGPIYDQTYKIGFVYGTNNPDGLGPKFHDDTYNPNDLDFSGYHTQD